MNRHPDCEVPGICSFCAGKVWCENSSEHGKLARSILRWICAFVALVIILIVAAIYSEATSCSAGRTGSQASGNLPKSDDSQSQTM